MSKVSEVPELSGVSKISDCMTESEAALDVYGLGNALLDIEYEVTSEFLDQHQIQKGIMTLVDEARQLALAEALGDMLKRKVACGGSAANTLVALSYFGGRGFYSCKIANDEAGRLFYHDLKASGLSSNLDFQPREIGHTGKCMAFVTHDADRTMNTFLGITESFSVDQLCESAIKKAKYLYIEGYLMTSPSAFLAVKQAKTIAKANQINIAITLSDPFIVGHFKHNFLEIVSDGVDLLFCNQEEALMFTGAEDLESAAVFLKKIARTFVITLGAQGSLVFDGQVSHLVPVEPVKVVDTLGAGDMYAGAFLAGLTQGLSFKKAGELASMAASKIVMEYGSRLSQQEILKIKQKFLADNGLVQFPNEKIKETAENR